MRDLERSGRRRLGGKGRAGLRVRNNRKTAGSGYGEERQGEMALRSEDLRCRGRLGCLRRWPLVAPSSDGLVWC